MARLVLSRWAGAGRRWVRDGLLWSLLGLAAALTGCADAPSLTAEAPLFVFSSYPAAGATVLRDDLTEIAFTLSIDLGEPRHGRLEGAKFFSLEGPNGPVQVLQEGLTNVAYDSDAQLLRVVLGSDLRDGLATGRYEARLAAGLMTEAGEALPLDYVVRFRLMAAPVAPTP